jgi:hypothetical protein
VAGDVEMEVSIRGYRRDCGWNYLVKEDFSDREISEKFQYEGKKSAWCRSGDKIIVRRLPVGISLNGQYILDVEISKEEILEMFKVIYSDQPISTLFD